MSHEEEGRQNEELTGSRRTGAVECAFPRGTDRSPPLTPARGMRCQVLTLVCDDAEKSFETYVPRLLTLDVKGHFGSMRQT
eukprot:3788008-Rhodomonas_salina.2